METITAIIEPDADGTLHLPLPDGMRQGKVLVQATLQPVPDTPTPAKAGIWGNAPGFWMADDFDEPLEEFREYME